MKQVKFKLADPSYLGKTGNQKQQKTYLLSLCKCSKCSTRLSLDGGNGGRLLPSTTEWSWNTYSMAMPQCFPALSPAAWKPERPMRATVGVMVRGPMYFSRAPGRPRRPMTTSIREDMMIAPWIWNKQGHRHESKLLIYYVL